MGGAREVSMLNIGVIGCGFRSISLISHFKGRKGVRIWGAWDPIQSNARLLLQHQQQPDGKIYSSFEELVNDQQVDWVFVGSPNAFHKEHIIAAFRAGKHVFSEKPLATSIEDCVAINGEHAKSGKLFATGFTLRYASIYRKVKSILDSGVLGKIVSINACENIRPDHGYYIMCNWRRRGELAGPHILEKCVHDLDLLNWFCDSVPLKIAAFGGNNMFVPENESLYHRHRSVFEVWEKSIEIDRFDEAADNAFIAEKTIEDNVVAIMEYANSCRVQFQATMSNSLPERRMYFHCTGGNL
ncbi:MAG: Gfo/Idh/MocA family oxidoreductase, partial [Spirochaetota bacterium]